MPRPVGGLHPLVVLWFVIGAIICAIDGVYIYYRPAYVAPTAQNPAPAQRRHPLADHPIVGGWEGYAQVDGRYQPTEDSALLNTILIGNGLEILLMVAAVACGPWASVAANSLSLVCNVMILYKTLFYYTLHHMEGRRYIAHNDATTLLAMFYLPALPWIVCPVLCIVSNIRRIQAAGPQTATSAASQAAASRKRQ